MKATTSLQLFCHAISNISSITNRKNDQALLGSILIEAKEGKLELSATDQGTLSAQISVEAEVEEEGSFCVNPGHLSEVLKEFPDEKITFKIKNNTLKIDCQKSKNIHFSLLIQKSTHFPKINFDYSEKELILKSREILEMIQKINHAIAINDETRPYLNGIHIQIIKSKLRAVASDGHRLSMIDFKIQEDSSIDESLSHGITIPQKGISEIKKIATKAIENQKEDIILSLSGSLLYVRLDDSYKVNINLISREYPNYEAVIPKQTNHKIMIDTKIFESAIKRIKTMSNKTFYGIKLKMSPQQLELTANDPSLGDALETIPIKYEGEEMSIGFNAKYLLDVLSHFGEGSIDLEFNNKLSPILLKSKELPHYLNVVMPLQL